MVVALSACGGSSNGGGGGGGNTVAPTITTQPSDQTVVVNQTATFSVTATGTAPLSYQWLNAATGTNIPGATSRTYTTPPAQLADNGSTFRVDVINTAGTTLSLAATLTVNPAPPPSNVKVLTYHNDPARTGLNSNETTLTTANVNSVTFGKIGTISVDGLVDAEPLYVGGLTVNGAPHNVVFVVTEHDSVYAFDADTFTQLWKHSVLGAGESPSEAINGCPQVTPEIGITSTPVIDPIPTAARPNGAIFVVAMSKSGTTYFHRLHALDLTTGAEIGTPTTISATFPGTATGSSGGTVTFDPKQYKDRAALLLLNGVIYTTWASHCDRPNYTGWVIGYNESTRQQVTLNITPNGTTQGGLEGAIWMAGGGPAADSSGNFYLLTGNGTFDTTLDANKFPVNGDYGNAFLKISTSGNSLSVADYFTMHDTVSESNNDFDFGSGGAVVLVDMNDNAVPPKTWHLAVGAGKDSRIYVLNRDNLGKFNPNNDNAAYQVATGAFSCSPGIAECVFSTPALFNGTLYYGAVDDYLKAFPFVNAQLSLSPLKPHSPATFVYPGTTPSISANGTSNGIVWAIEGCRSATSCTGSLHAYDATNLANELYNSNQAAGGRDQFSTNSRCKYVTPMIANGKVYVGTATGVVVFGLF